MRTPAYVIVFNYKGYFVRASGDFASKVRASIDAQKAEIDAIPVRVTHRPSTEELKLEEELRVRNERQAGYQDEFLEAMSKATPEGRAFIHRLFYGAT